MVCVKTYNKHLGRRVLFLLLVYNVGHMLVTKVARLLIDGGILV